MTIQLDPSEEQRLRQLAGAWGQDVSECARRVLAEYLRRLPTSVDAQPVRSLSRAEAQLLQEVNQGLPEVTWQRYHGLVARRRDGTLTHAELEELISLTDDIELAHARRMEKLVDLARLRQVSLDDLMDELGIRDPGYV